jgi:3-oxoadipate enol-lactonase
MPVAITGSTSIDYDISGEGPPLLLIGGLGFGRWGWFKQVPAFSRHFRTITFDVRGERRLENGVGDLVGEVVSLLGHLGVKKAHVLGTSLGGFVAQELALVRPDLVERLVLVCTSYGGRGPESMSPQALSDILGWGSFSAEGMVSRGLETATSETYRAEHLDEFEQIVDWRLSDSPSDMAYYEQARAGASFDLSRDVGHITSPTLVIHGAEDRYVPVANAAALAGAIPEAKLRVLDDAGHLVFIERFADVNREVVAFLKPRGSGRQVRDRGVGSRRAWVWRWVSGLARSLGRRLGRVRDGII